jgi:hypothetical protein
VMISRSSSTDFGRKRVAANEAWSSSISIKTDVSRWIS